MYTHTYTYIPARSFFLFWYLFFFSIKPNYRPRLFCRHDGRRNSVANITNNKRTHEIALYVCVYGRRRQRPLFFVYTLSSLFYREHFTRHKRRGKTFGSECMCSMYLPLQTAFLLLSQISVSKSRAMLFNAR